MRQRGLPEKLEIFLFLYWNEMASRKKGRRWNKEDKILWISARCIVHPLTFPFFFFRINFSPKLVPLQSGKDLWHIFPSQQKPQTSPESWEWIEVKTGVGSGTFFSEVQDEIRSFVYFNSFSRILIICNGGDREALQILRNTAVLPEKFFCKQSPRFLLSFTTVFPTPCIHRSTHSPLPVIRGWSAHMGGLYLWLWRKIFYLKLC